MREESVLLCFKMTRARDEKRTTSCAQRLASWTGLRRNVAENEHVPWWLIAERPLGSCQG